MIFGRNVVEKVISRNVLNFPPHLTSASALSGETQKLKSHFFTQVLCYCIERLQTVFIHHTTVAKEEELEMWANAQRDGRPAEYR